MLKKIFGYLLNVLLKNQHLMVKLKKYDNNINNFGSKCEISDKFIEKLVKLGLLERIQNTIELENTKLLKKTDGTKKGSIRGIKKLDDANFTGTKQSE